MESSIAPQQNVDEEHGTTQQVVVDGKVSSSDARNITMLQDPISDYILVSNEPIAAFFHRSWRERYGVHMLIWMCFATCLWGANLIILVAGMEFFPNLKMSRGERGDHYCCRQLLTAKKKDERPKDHFTCLHFTRLQM